MMTTPPKPAARTRTKHSALALALAFAAAESRADYHVSAYENSPGFSEIMSADYAGAGAAIPSYSPIAPSFALSTNRCVSEILADTLDSALESCNKALRKMPNHLELRGAGSLKERNAIRSDLMSNRGVVLALQGKLAEAEADFALAMKLDGDNANAEKNLAYLKSLKVSQR